MHGFWGNGGRGLVEHTHIARKQSRTSWNGMEWNGTGLVAVLVPWRLAYLYLARSLDYLKASYHNKKNEWRLPVQLLRFQDHGSN